MTNTEVTIIVPSNGHLDALHALIWSFNQRTEDKSKVKFLLIDNCNTNGIDLFSVMSWFHLDVDADLLKLEKRFSLTNVYNIGFDQADTQWVIYINEDTVFEKHWQRDFDRLVKSNPHQIFLLCKPYNWSGFAISRNFFKENGPFNDDYPEGCYEDDELYLNLAEKNGFTEKKDIYTKAIYCMDYIEGRGIIQHIPQRKSRYWARWDSNKNFKVFSKLWVQCAPEDSGAIENKDGKYYRRP